MVRFNQLDAYTVAIEYVGVTRPLVLRLRRADPFLADQLHRAVLSIPCNIAEGAGEFSNGDKRKFYRYALRSASETVALLDSAHVAGLADAAAHRRGSDLALRLVAMLTRLVLSTPLPPTPGAPGSNARRGSGAVPSPVAPREKPSRSVGFAPSIAAANHGGGPG